MATSRTGTASHRHFRKEVLTRGQEQGITHCPECSTPLDYENSRYPNSAEPDHIIPVALGGTNHPDNGRVLCRRCNQRRGKGKTKKASPTRTPISTSYQW